MSHLAVVPVTPGASGGAALAAPGGLAGATSATDGRGTGLHDQQFREALASSPIILARVDAELRYEWILNPHPDFDGRALIGRRDDELASDPGSLRLLALKRRTFETGEPQREEITFELSHGPETYDVSAVPVRAADGSLEAVTTASVNITDRRRAEDALREREAQLAMVFASIDQGFCLAEMIVDDAGRPVDYRLLEVNGQFEAMTGVADAAGRRALEVVPGLESHWIERYARVAFGGVAERFEAQSEAMGRWFDVFATPVEPRGRFALVFSDITRRKETDRRLAEALAIKDEFLGMVSHELRTPLTVVYGMSRMLSRPDLPPDRARAIATDIAESAETLNGLVDSMLLLAKLDGDEASRLREPVLLHHAAQHVLSRLRARDPHRTWELVVHTRNTLVSAQPGWVERVIENLAGNAGKYSGPGRTVRVTIEPADDGVAVRVEDEGPGISEAQEELVFEPFYRAPGAHEVAAGAGLGLAVSRRIVGLLGGRIWAKARPTGGAEFGFSLPLGGEPD